MASSPELPEVGIVAPDFNLLGVDGRRYTLKDVAGPKGTVIVFTCNHCPYAVAVSDRMAADAETLKAEGIGFAAICSNDASTHPADSFENMKVFADQHRFGFPYLHDEDQSAAHAYKAVCTPDFYGLDAGRTILYRGRLDEGRTEPPPPGAKKELVDAMRMIAARGVAPETQLPSVGCGIKWKC